MRTIVTILLMMFLAQTTKAQEFIFETTAGEIVTKSKFIDQFQNDVYTNLSSTYKCNFLGADNKQ